MYNILTNKSATVALFIFVWKRNLSFEIQLFKWLEAATECKKLLGRKDSQKIYNQVQQVLSLEMYGRTSTLLYKLFY